MSSVLELAKTLQQLPASKIETLLIEARGSSAGLTDMFDLAKLLLGKRELERRIRKLELADIEALRNDAPTPKLKSQLLAGQQCYPEAVELAKKLGAEAPQATYPQGGSLVCYETLLAITELLFALEQSWFETTKSGIRSADAKSIAEKLHCPPSLMQQRFHLAQQAGLVIAHRGRWAASPKGQTWLSLDRAEAWLQLASAIWDLPNGKFDTGNLPAAIAARYPLLPLSQLSFLNFAHLIGLLDQGEAILELSSPSLDLAEAVMHTLPQPEDRLILQSDLSIICPGPISPSLHRRLDSFADSEELGLASRFRLSALSISHHLETGGTLDEVTSVLVKFSGKDLPQPVHYLLSDVERKFGQLKIWPREKTAITSQDPILLAQIANERSLQHLGLSQIGNELRTNAGQELCYFSLRAASYAAVMVDRDGQVLSPRLENPDIELVDQGNTEKIRAEKLVASELSQGSQSDIRRALQFALKNKLTVSLSFEDAHGGVQSIRLMPLGITESRLRGRETVREAERTLPLARIRSVLLD